MTIFMVSFLFFTSQAEKLTSIFSITGQSAACTEQVYSYSVADDPSVYYEWTITGGAFVSSPVGSHDGDVVPYR